MNISSSDMCRPCKAEVYPMPRFSRRLSTPDSRPAMSGQLLLHTGRPWHLNASKSPHLFILGTAETCRIRREAILEAFQPHSAVHCAFQKPVFRPLPSYPHQRYVYQLQAKEGGSGASPECKVRRSTISIACTNSASAFS